MTTITTQELKTMFTTACEVGSKITGRDIREEGYKLKLVNHKRALGVCNYSKKYVGISRHHLVDRSQVNNTMLHEVAHALTKGDGHGYAWKSLFLRMGGNGETRATVTASYVKKLYSYKVVNQLTGETVCGYYSKPNRDFSKCQLKGKPETLGNLILVKC